MIMITLESNLVYIVVWEYKDASGISAIFDNEESAEEYKHWCEHKTDYDFIYHVARFVVGTKSTTKSSE